MNTDESGRDVKARKWIDCCLCDSLFGSDDELTAHLSSIHLGWTPYSCRYCPEMRLPSVRSLLNHQRVTHPERASIVEYHVNVQQELQLLDLLKRCAAGGPIQLPPTVQDSVPFHIPMASDSPQPAPPRRSMPDSLPPITPSLSFCASSAKDSFTSSSALSERSSFFQENVKFDLESMSTDYNDSSLGDCGQSPSSYHAPDPSTLLTPSTLAGIQMIYSGQNGVTTRQTPKTTSNGKQPKKPSSNSKTTKTTTPERGLNPPIKPVIAGGAAGSNATLNQPRNCKLCARTFWRSDTLDRHMFGFHLATIRKIYRYECTLSGCKWKSGYKGPTWYKHKHRPGHIVIDRRLQVEQEITKMLKLAPLPQDLVLNTRRN